MKNLLSFIAFVILTTATATATELSIGGLDRVQLNGRIQYDHLRSELDGATTYRGTNLRSGRLALSGDLTERYSFKVQFNVDGKVVEDMYMRYKFGGGTRLTIGNQKMPFGLEQLTNSNDISMLERSVLTRGFALGRREGLVLSNNWWGGGTWAVGAWSDTLTDQGQGVAARMTRAFAINNGVAHLGLSWNSYKYESDIKNDYGEITTETTAAVLELGVTSGPLHMQTEFAVADDSITNIGDIITSGDRNRMSYYVQAGWMLTGESRPYKDGVFKRATPRGDSPAYELVLRYSYHSYDGDATRDKIDSSGMGIGINIYPHKDARLGLNYEFADEIGGVKAKALRLRAQLTF